MKKLFNWQVMLGVVLIALSAGVYVVHYLIFRDAHHIFIYLVGDIAFAFFEVLLVTLILHRLLMHRERQVKFQKLNMVIDAFFSEVGTKLLEMLSSFDCDKQSIASKLLVNASWTKREFATARYQLKKHEFCIDADQGDLAAVKQFLLAKRAFMLRLLENPNILEHETFSDLLWAVSHLTEELMYRTDVAALPPVDRKHLAGDIKRAYSILIREWVTYIRHLKVDYPYLFSLAIRLNPFNEEASVVIRT